MSDSNGPLFAKAHMHDAPLWLTGPELLLQNTHQSSQFHGKPKLSFHLGFHDCVDVTIDSLTEGEEPELRGNSNPSIGKRLETPEIQVLFSLEKEQKAQSIGTTAKNRNSMK